MYRSIQPESRQELPMRMLHQPAGDGLFLRASEADGYRGLVAALLDDPGYETADLETRLRQRLSLADEVVFLFQVGGRSVAVSDRDGANTINVHSDEELIMSLHRLGFISLAGGPQR